MRKGRCAMGWANCGTDSEGRPIGYAFEAVCDHPGCERKIDRGLGYACGDMHGGDEYSCEKYFCEQHLCIVQTPDGRYISLCGECYDLLEIDDELTITGAKDDAS